VQDRSRPTTFELRAPFTLAAGARLGNQEIQSIGL